MNLGTTESFAVLAGAGVTNTGPSIISGDLGACPTPAITGFPPGTVINGTIHAADAVCLQAQSDLVIAYNDAAGRAPTTTYPGVQDLGGLTLTPGVYQATAFAITGTLTLDAQGDPGAVWIFQAGSTLITAVNSSVMVINGGQPCNVFWQVGSSATLGVGSTFVGTILALTSITANTNATVQGRLLARNGAVTLDSNTVTRPVCAPLPTTTSSTSTSTTLAPTTSSSTTSTSTTVAPTTSSSTTVPPITVPPITVPPITLPPITVPPITVPPITVAPITVPPITVPPITVPPITVPPITVPPITVPPITVPPITEPPITLPTTTSTSTTLLPTTTSTTAAIPGTTTTTAVGATTTTGTGTGTGTGATTTSSSTTTVLAAETTTTSTTVGSTTGTGSTTTTVAGTATATTIQGGGTAAAVTTGTLVRTGSAIRSMQFWAVVALGLGSAMVLLAPRPLAARRRRRRRFELP